MMGGGIAISSRAGVGAAGVGVGVGVGIRLGKGTDSTTPSPPLPGLLVAREMERETWRWEGCSSRTLPCRGKPPMQRRRGA